MRKTTAKELAFFGRITAGFTHEIKNILAIIKESSGLMEDLLLLTKDDPFPHWERFSRRVLVIRQQVQRGVELANRLNRFAHSPDEPVSRIELNELADQLVRLSERFARLKEVTLKSSCSESAVALVTSPVELQMAVFTLMESCWNQMQAGSEIDLTVELREKRPCMSIRLIGETGDMVTAKQKVQSSESFRATQELLGELGGEILTDNQDGFTLAFVETKE